MYRQNHDRIQLVCLVHIFVKIILSTGVKHGAEEGRFIPPLIVPQTSPTRHQLIAGIGIPLGTPISITTGYVLKAQYFLPISVNDLKPHLWDGWNETRRVLEKRDAVTILPGQRYEQYTATDVEIKSEPLPEGDEEVFEDGDDNYWLDEEEFEQHEDAEESMPSIETGSEGYNAEHSRWTTYKTLEKIGESYGAGGRACVLRSICEAAEAEFTHTGGIFAELLHILFTPSTTTEPLSDHNDNEYHRAEQLGREGAPCHLVFRECNHSILDVFTGVHDTALDSITVGHKSIMDELMRYG
ncbi:uncharacterized protein LOC129779860 [Toxorhynchites rutilus septentrionalis]|uniref:uncharacterized protein LOC129779860 n=1 Tax=Toxorhynchites rutilus septentrionalis TaxID=329112 RepID=UPI0024798EE0|nr:uncharacterized protein LOC129779860 [Toxorhynchites rutilus septentrionalis]